MTHAGYDIGLATIDITPPAGITLSGYGTRAGQASGVDHPLRAEALVCRGDGAHPGFFDPTVLLVGVRREAGTLEALIVNYGCHPVTLGPDNLQISADHVGYLKDAVEPAGAARSVTEPWTIERERQGRPQRVTADIQSLRAGDLAIAAIPGELFSEYAERFRQASPLPATLVVSMANGAVGYLPVDEAYPQGGLEVMRAACPDVEQPLTEHVTRALAGLA